MSESFKINIYFDEKGESLESLIEHLIINMLDINDTEKQSKRPYTFLEVEVNKKSFLVPLRSNLNFSIFSIYIDEINR